MADPTEENIPAPVPVASAGLIDRLKAAMGFRPENPEEDAVVAGLKLQIEQQEAAIVMATEKIQGLNNELTIEKAIKSTLEAKVAAIEAVIPGLTSSAEPAKMITDEVIKRTAEQAAAAGIPENQAPSNQAPPEEPEKIKTRAEFDKLTTPEQNAFFRSGGKLTD